MRNTYIKLTGLCNAGLLLDPGFLWLLLRSLSGILPQQRGEEFNGKTKIVPNLFRFFSEGFVTRIVSETASDRSKPLLTVRNRSYSFQMPLF